MPYPCQHHTNTILETISIPCKSNNKSMPTAYHNNTGPTQAPYPNYSKSIPGNTKAIQNIAKLNQH